MCMGFGDKSLLFWSLTDKPWKADLSVFWFPLLQNGEQQFQTHEVISRIKSGNSTL